MVDREMFNKEKEEVSGQIDSELKKMWGEGTATIQEYKELEEKQRRVKEDFERRNAELMMQEIKAKITSLRKGSLLLVGGWVVNAHKDLAARKVKLLRKGSKRATIEVMEDILKGKKYRIPYSWLVPFTKENREKMEHEREMYKDIF